MSGPSPIKATLFRGWTVVRYAVEDSTRGDLILSVRALFGKKTENYRVSLPVKHSRGVALVKCPGIVECVEFSGNLPSKFNVERLKNARVLLGLLFFPLVKMLRSPKRILEILRRTVQSGIRHGVVGMRASVLELIFEIIPSVKNDYLIWVENFDTLTASDRAGVLEAIKGLSYRPKFSIILPVFNAPKRYLELAIRSVLDQLYSNWELCIADDASTNPEVKRVLESYRFDPRVKIKLRTKNGHISEASNSALELASGDFIVLLDHDDELSPRALSSLAFRLNEDRDLDFIYSDEDKIDGAGRRFAPHFKTDWNPDLLLSYNFITHLACIRRSLVESVGGFRAGFEGSQDYDLFLRIVAKTKRIAHIPKVLYHWRATAGSTALGPNAKIYAHENARRSLREYLANQGVTAQVLPGFDSYHRVTYPLPSPAPLVSILICTRDRKDLLEGIVADLLTKTDYPQLEIIVVDNQSRLPETLSYFQSLKFDTRVRVLKYDHPFNYSAMNNWAASQARGEILGFLNNDLRVIDSIWLSEMVSLAVQPQVGAVGAKLHYKDKSIQHAGIVLGLGGVAGHPMKHQLAETRHFTGRANVIQSYSAVTGACLVIKKRLFEEAGKFDETDLPIAFSDVDLGIRLRERGYRNIWTPYARLFHLESASRGSDEAPSRRERFERENEVMKLRWGKILQNDPFYNPNLTLHDETCTPAFPPRITGGESSCG